MIIDTHSHYMPPDVAPHTTFFKQFWSDSAAQLKAMDANRVDAALLLYPTSDAHLQMGGWSKVCDAYNRGIAELVKASQGRFIGGGIIPVDAPEKIGTELERIQDLGLKVLSLASSYNGRYLDDPIFEEVFEFAVKASMPIHVHAQIMQPIGIERVDDPLLTPVLEYVMDVSMCLGKMMMSGVFQKHPKVKFIFAHYGGVLPLVKDRFDTTYAMLRRRNFVKDLGRSPSAFFKNIYIDMSGSQSPASLLAALEVVDAKHVCFGSDFPANQNMAGALNTVSANILSSEDRQNICGGNILSLIKK